MRKGSFAPGEFYHVYNRGTEKRIVFLDDTDYQRFLALLYVCNGTNYVHLSNIGRLEQGETLLKKILLEDVNRGDILVDICVYCPMPNHFHLLLREKSDTGISKFMQRLTTGYTMYFNKKYERTGALFQGVFRSSHISKDTYLKYLPSYIHLNPIKIIEPTWKESGIKDVARAKQYLSKYRYSSYLDYCGVIRDENAIINKTALPDYYCERDDFQKEVFDWLIFKE
jgi:putative transposase